MFARPFIDSVDFARNGKELRGEVAVSALSRLDDVLANPAGLLTYIVRGYRNADCDMLGLSLYGTCILRCQRCLSEMEYPLALEIHLRLLPEDRLHETDDDDAVDAIAISPSLDVLALLEEELLLELPFAPRHAEGECAKQATDIQLKASPFAVLAGLKK